MNSLSEIAKVIGKQKSFTIITHTSPDGDALGSALGLGLMLKKLKKDVQVVCDNVVPAIYMFLPGAKEVCYPSFVKHCGCAISVDCADKHRMGGAAVFFEESPLKVQIDHHATNLGFADYNFIDANSASTGEIIYKLASELNVAVDQEIATCIYTAIITDTGRFANSNTASESLSVAAKLVDAGADPHEINRRIYDNNPVGKLRLLGAALGKLELHSNGRIGLTTVAQSDMTATGATADDCEGIVDHVRSIDSVEIAVLIRQARDGSYKVSMRSKGGANVDGIAAKNGGGGHAKAAGFTSPHSLPRTRTLIINAAAEELNAGVEV